MDFWNRKKVRELEQKLVETEKKLRGKRVCDGYCDKCEYGIKRQTWYIGGVTETWICELDCKCKDFKKK